MPSRREELNYSSSEITLTRGVVPEGLRGSFLGYENILELDSGDGAQPCEYTRNH